MIVCLREAVGDANKTKRRAQRIIALYVEKMAADHLEPKDRDFLDGLCKRVRAKDADD